MLGLDLAKWQVVAFNWAVMAVVICGVTYYYGGFDRYISNYWPETPVVATKELREKSSKKKQTKSKPNERVASGTDSGSAIDSRSSKTISVPAAKKMAAASTLGTDQKQTASGVNKKDTDKKADMDFANSLNKAKRGTDFSSSKNNSMNSRVRTVKSKYADESSHGSTTTSSTGQYGDDETSRTGSPAVKPTTSGAVPDSISRDGMLEPDMPAVKATSSADVPDTTGVKDMLEPANKTVKSISLVGDFQQVQSKKQKSTSKAPEPTETKKQRQQRRKREEEKDRIAQSNKEHDAKREQQMRGARMAEGTSNQSKADAFKSPANAWTPTSNQTQAAVMKKPVSETATTAPVTPLDTFESKPAGSAVGGAAVTTQPIDHFAGQQNSTTGVNGLKKELGTQTKSALAASDREQASETPYPLQRTESWADQMDEEEQVKLAQEDSQEWEPVVAKKDKKKVRKADADITGESNKRMNEQAPQSTAGKANGTSLRQQPKAAADNRYGSLVTDSPSNGAGDEDKEETWEA